MITIQSPVRFSSKAMGELTRIRDSGKIPPDHFLRIGIRDAGSPAMSYLLGFDNKKDGDNEYKAEEFTVYIQKTEVPHLAGMTIDYYEGPEASGFIFLPS